ncbi:MAG: hypothetical protein WC819_03880 [Parcubacteria group bacterium]|jgi:hypothetical protein
MENKTKKSDNTTIDPAYVFEVHTMKKDATTMPKTSQEKNEGKMESKGTFGKNEQLQQNLAANPFLDAQEQSSTDPFANTPKKEQQERINQVPSDMVQEGVPLPLKKPSTPPQKKNSLHSVMIVFVVLFLIGAMLFGGYLLMNRRAPVEIDLPVEETVVDDKVVSPEESHAYALDLPNYFSFDVESATAKNDIASGLKTIKGNMQNSDIQEPVKFIVTDAHNNPVSFHVFAISSGINLPQEIISSLEENFEIYAYKDPSYGVRFGLAIDTKNVNLLQESLKTKESELPKSLALFFDNLIVVPQSAIFNDSTYNTHPIRYTNLDQSESYSVDYTINGQRLIVGTSKDTLRAMLDDIKNDTIAPSKSGEFTY